MCRLHKRQKEPNNYIIILKAWSLAERFSSTLFLLQNLSVSAEHSFFRARAPPLPLSLKFQGKEEVRWQMNIT